MSNPRTDDKGMLRTYGWIVALVTLLTVAVGAAVALRQPAAYSAQAKVQVLPVATRGAPVLPDMGTERELATSGAVADDAAARLALSTREAASGLSVSVVADASVLVIGYSAATPQGAYAGADAFARSYLEVRNDRQHARAATMITKPDVPTSSTGIDYALVLAVALLAGLGLGVGCAWLWDRVSDRVRSSTELERAGLPVLANRVSLPRRKVGITASGREHFRYLAGRLDTLVGRRRDHVRIVVTAPRALSGSSAVALNVAAGIAGMGRRVVLVDADLRSRGVSALLPGEPLPGFLELVNGATTVEKAARPLWLERVRLVPSIVSKPPPATDVDLTSLAVERLAARDIVVLDAPPLLEAPEAALLADHADVVLLVADMSSLSRSDVARTLRVAGHLSAPVVGWVTHNRRTGKGDTTEQDMVADTVALDEPLPTVRPLDAAPPVRR